MYLFWYIWRKRKRKAPQSLVKYHMWEEARVLLGSSIKNTVRYNQFFAQKGMKKGAVVGCSLKRSNFHFGKFQITVSPRKASPFNTSIHKVTSAKEIARVEITFVASVVPPGTALWQGTITSTVFVIIVVGSCEGHISVNCKWVCACNQIWKKELNP